MSKFQISFFFAAAAIASFSVQAEVVLPAIDWYKTVDNQCLEAVAINDVAMEFNAGSAICMMRIVENADGTKH